MSKPPKSSEPREPTLDQLLAIMPADDRQFWESGDGSPQRRGEFLEGIKAQWKSRQPVTPPSNPEPPKSKSDDLAEDRADEIRHQQKVADAFKEKPKDLLLPQPEPLPPLESGELPSRDGLAGMLAPPPATLWDKFWHLTESNLFMGGGVGMAIAAYAFLISGAPKFATILLVVSWLVIIVSTQRHNFFEGKPRRTQLIGQTLISGSVAVILIVLWLALRPPRPQQGTSNSQQQAAPDATPSISVPRTPEWKELDESKRISSEMMDSVQKLIKEGKAIDTTNVRHAAKTFADWAERCSVIMGKIDSQMEQMNGQETNYKIQCPSTQGIFKASKELLKVSIDIAVLRLTIIQIKMPFDMLVMPSQTSTTINSSPQRTPVASPSIVSRAGEPTPSPPITSVPQLSVVPVHFNRQIVVTGGSPQRLSTLLVANGYTGGMLLQEITYHNLDMNEDNLYLGQSDVDPSNGFELSPGTYDTTRTVDATQIYLFIKKSAKVGISLTSK